MVAAAILIVPTIVGAQVEWAAAAVAGAGPRRVRPRIGERWAAQVRRHPKTEPGKALLDKRKDFKIDDAQKAQLENIANRLRLEHQGVRRG